MKNCTIRIETESEGERSVFQTHGKFSREETVRVEYLQEGDSVTLEFYPNGMQMTRSGLGLSGTFFPNRCSLVTLSVGSQTAEIPVRNVHYRYAELGSELEILLRYELSLRESFHLVTLKILVFHSEDR